MADGKTVSVKAPVDFMSLVKFDKTKKDILDLAKKSKDLKIDGMEDKEGYKAVHEAQMVLQKIRVKGENDRLEFSRMLIATRDKLKEYHDDVFSPVIEEEARLKAMKDEIEAEKQKIKAAEADKERARIQDMVSRLTESGATYNPMSPQNNAEYGYGDLKIDMVMLSTMAESVFDSFIENVVETKKIEDDRIAAEEAESVAAQKKLDDQAAAQEAKQKELDAKEEKIRIAQKEIDDKKVEELKQKEIAAGIEKAKEEMAAQLKKEAEEKDEREAEEESAAAYKAAKNKKYIAWLAKHHLTIEEISGATPLKSEYWVEGKDGVFTLYKKIDEITIK